MSNDATHLKFSLRILIVDDLHSDRNDLVELLSGWGHQPIVVSGIGDTLFNAAVAQVQSSRCHIALVDAKLLPESGYDLSGLDLIPHLHPALSIVITVIDNPAVFRQAGANGAFSYVGKQEKPDKLKGEIDRAVRNIMGEKQPRTIDWRGNLSSSEIVNRFFPNNAAVPRDEAEDLLRRLFPHAQTLKIVPLGRLSLGRPGVPRHHSLIVRAWADQLPSVLVKIGFKERIQKELQNYMEHVKDKLNGGFYAQFQRSVDLWDLGGIIYNFQGTYDRELELFSKYYKNNPEEPIVETIKHLFDKIWSDEYQRTRKTHEESLFLAYSQIWGNQWLNRLIEFRNSVIKSPSIINQQLYPNPVNWLIEHVDLINGCENDKSKLPIMYKAITHGDLRGDTIFVDPISRRVWVSDYKRTGLGPILQDFVELEADILTRLMSIDDILDFQTLIIALIRPQVLDKILDIDINNREAIKAWGIIYELRQLARRHTSIPEAEDYLMESYLWGLLFNAVYIATLLQERGEDMPRRNRALLLGSLICNRLEYGDTWTPIPLPAKRVTVQVNGVELFQSLKKHFNEDELDTLCFELGVDYESFPGRGKEHKARELVQYALRHGLIDKLIARLREIRPNADW